MKDTDAHHTWALALSGILAEAALLLLLVWRDASPASLSGRLAPAMLALGQWLSVLCLAISVKLFWQVLQWSGWLAEGGRSLARFSGRAGWRRGEYIHKIIWGGWLMMVMVVVRG